MFDHFITAQDLVYVTVLAELRGGLKRTHWMWFIFPQLRALGRSDRAIRYGIADLDEAGAYLQHDVLGPRLIECASLVLAVEGRTAIQIFGEIDALKLRSSMTLFAHAAQEVAVFRDVLVKYFAGEEDALTVGLLAA
jgi:uncharacterized protein (DUF1810 family)